MRSGRGAWGVGLVGLAAAAVMLGLALAPGSDLRQAIRLGPKGRFLPAPDKQIEDLVLSDDGRTLYVRYTPGIGRGGGAERGDACVDGMRPEVNERADRVEVRLIGQRWKPFRLPFVDQPSVACPGAAHFGAIDVPLADPLGARPVISSGEEQWVFRPPNPSIPELPGGYRCGPPMNKHETEVVCHRVAESSLRILWSSPTDPVWQDLSPLRAGEVDVTVIGTPAHDATAEVRSGVRWRTPRGMVRILAADFEAQREDIIGTVAFVDALDTAAADT